MIKFIYIIAIFILFTLEGISFQSKPTSTSKINLYTLKNPIFNVKNGDPSKKVLQHILDSKQQSYKLHPDNSSKDNITFAPKRDEILKSTNSLFSKRPIEEVKRRNEFNENVEKLGTLRMATRILQNNIK